MVLPLPTSGEWHLHGSPPCTKVSQMNQARVESEKDDGVTLILWYLKFAMDSGATTWSMEQVTTKCVVAAIESLKRPGSAYRSRIAYTVVDMYDIGVAQRRKRLIAGSPHLIARIGRLETVHRSVRDMIPNPRGTHVRGELYNCLKRKRVNGKIVASIRVTYGHDDACHTIDGPGLTVTASNGMRWATPGSGAPSFHMTPREIALLQTFPAHYRLPKEITHAVRGVGNAVPPLAIRKLLVGDRFTVSSADTPSFLWRPPIEQQS